MLITGRHAAGPNHNTPTQWNITSGGNLRGVLMTADIRHQGGWFDSVMVSFGIRR